MRLPCGDMSAGRGHSMPCPGVLSPVARRLTGSVTFSLADGAEAKVLIDSSPVGALTYTLVANGRKVDEGTKARGSVWSVPLGPGASGEAAAASSAACTAADVEFGEPAGWASAAGPEGRR